MCYVISKTVGVPIGHIPLTEPFLFISLIIFHGNNNNVCMLLTLTIN